MAYVGALQIANDRGETCLGAVSVCRAGGDANRSALPSGRPAAPWLFPVSGGYITDDYGWRIRPTTGKRQFHEGLDIGRGEGSPIIAPAPGRITYINQDPTKTSGRYVAVEHDDGWKSLYLHLLTPAVRTGERVNSGQQIGLMGSTGAVTGPHLHWIVKDPCGNVVNPLATLSGTYPKKGGGTEKGLYNSGGVPWALVAVGAVGLFFLTQRRR